MTKLMLVPFEREGRNIGTGVVGSSSCGDVLRLQIRVSGRTIQDAKFKAYGCGSAITSSALITELLKGKALEQAAAIRNTEITRELTLPPIKTHCSVLAQETVRAAIADYHSKND